jgi:hypothetical protein
MGLPQLLKNRAFDGRREIQPDYPVPDNHSRKECLCGHSRFCPLAHWWLESELRRFHRGISITLLFLAVIILAVETARNLDFHERLFAAVLLFPVALVTLRLLALLLNSRPDRSISGLLAEPLNQLSRIHGSCREIIRASRRAGSRTIPTSWRCRWRS